MQLSLAYRDGVPSQHATVKNPFRFVELHVLLPRLVSMQSSLMGRLVVGTEVVPYALYLHSLDES